MLYWLFTEGRDLLAPLTLPLLCASILLPVLVIGLSGANIRRTSGDRPLVGSRWSLLTYGIVALTVSALYLSLAGGGAIQRAHGRQTVSVPIQLITGAPPHINAMRLFTFGVIGLFVVGLSLITLHSAIRDGGWLREGADRLRYPQIKRGALGSSHFCTLREFRRFRRADPDGLTLLGAFWGEGRRRLDVGQGTFSLSGEDIARGILTLGGPGSGKTQGIILPAIADRMRAGHSLIVADPQGELTTHVLRFAAVTRHLVVVHDPTSAVGPRFNLVEGIGNVPDARAIADVLVPTMGGDQKFWSDNAAALLAACLIRFPDLGAIYNAMNDLKGLAKA
ncbi:MAG: type IV secretion system DNA-binding domain-containing protein, partial [Anaerolinea sp.]|nr:type IV secretion system DNA-binding domain-containing protein [Anaerolinea sp.]